jgi:RNA-binding protein YhbY
VPPQVAKAVDKNQPAQSQTTTQVPSAPSLNEAEEKDVFNLTSMIGYLNEYAVAEKLGHELEQQGVNVTTNIQEGLYAYYAAYKGYMLANIHLFKEPPAVVKKEIQRAEEGSEVMAAKMLSEIMDKTEDIKLIDVKIDLTGKEAAGAGKEDIVVTVSKKSTGEIIDLIKASLKLYKTASGVNVYNSTFPSYLMTIITGNDGEGLTGKKAIAHFLNDYPEYTEKFEKVLDITDEWKKIKTELKKSNDPNYRTAANDYITLNRGYQRMRDLLFIDVFNKFYAQDKAAINERVLNRLGLDGADDVYLLVGTEKQKMIAVSSRTSKEFGRLYENLKKDFTIKYDIPKNSDTVSCAMIIESEDGEELARFTIGFKEGSTFPHMWNMQAIVDDAKGKTKASKKSKK